MIGYHISDQVEFCNINGSSACKTQQAPTSTMHKAIFEVDFSTKEWERSGGIININSERIPIRWQREDCFCDWRLCNTTVSSGGYYLIIIIVGFFGSIVIASILFFVIKGQCRKRSSPDPQIKIEE